MSLPTGTQVHMSLAESLIARGYGFRLPFRINARPFNTTQTTIAAGASAYISIRHTKKSIMLIGRELIASETGLLYTVHKNPVITEYGAPVTILPMNGEAVMASDNTANIVAPASVQDQGEEVDSGIVSAGGNPNAQQGPYSTDEFKVLPHDADYLLRIHNTSNSAISMFALTLRWCELYPDAWP